MEQRRRGISKWVKVLLCALAIASGGAAAHFTDLGGLRAGADPLFPARASASLVNTAHAQAQAPLGPAAWVPPAEPVHDKEPYRELHPAPELPDPFGEDFARGMVINGHTPHRMILFTFDDGPDHRNTPRLLDMLDREQIKAVFFLTSNRFAGHGERHLVHQEIARDIVRRGHIVGNHTYGHQNLPSLDHLEFEHQVTDGQRVFERILGRRPWLLRPPGGGRSSRTDRLISERGYTSVMWNLGTGDTQVRSAEEVLDTFKKVLARREREDGDRGGIVLLHDIHSWSVEAFPMIVDWLRGENCRLLDEGEELYDFVGDPRYFYVPRGDHDASAEAPPAVLDPEVLLERQERIRERVARRCRQVAQR